VYTAQTYCAGQVDTGLLTTIQGPGVSPVVRLVAGSGAASALRGLDILAQKVGVEMVGVSASLEQSRVRIDPTFSPTEPSVALLVQGGSPKIKDTCLKGGPGLTAVDAGEQSFPGSTGVGVFLNGTPELTFSVIEGGSGDGSNKGVGSVGVFSRNSSPILRNNNIHGGKGTSSKLAGSVGVLIQSTGGPGSVSRPEIKNNGNLDGGEGTQVTGGRGSVGLLLRCLDAGGGCAGIDVSGERAISGNFISGGKGKNTGAAQAETQTGVWYHGGTNFEAASVIDLIDNRISGGTTNGGGSPTKPGPVALDLSYARGKIEKNAILGGQFNADSATGIRVVRSKNLRLVNNMIHSGHLSSSQNTGLRGIVFSEAQQLTIASNTLLMGSGAAVGRGITMLAEDANAPIPTGNVRIDNNLVLGNKDPHYGVEFQGCPAGRLLSFQGNGFVHLGGRAVFTSYDPADCVGNKVLSVGNFVKALGDYCSLFGGSGSKCGSLPANLGGNVGMSALCQDEVECTPIPGCIGFNECALALFQITQSTNDALVSELLTGPNRGWKLRENLPCSAVQSPFAPAFVLDDRYGTNRGNLHARGAHQQNSCDNVIIVPGG
jgi:hypothetical protein